MNSNDVLNIVKITLILDMSKQLIYYLLIKTNSKLTIFYMWRRQKNKMKLTISVKIKMKNFLIKNCLIFA
jgi:hypothetical protein